MTKTSNVPTTAPTIPFISRAAASLSKVVARPAGADFTLDAYADIETGARLIGQRAASQLREIVQRRQSA